MGSNNAIFFSDVHLLESASVKTQIVLRFLQEQASKFEKIFILGDLFDVWPGTNPFLIKSFDPILKELKKLTDEGHQITYVEGNHDFRLGEHFTRNLGIRVIPDSTEEKLGDYRVFLAHGDLGNPKDVGYRVLRGLLRADTVHRVANLVPSEWIFKLGRKASSLSRDYGTKSPEQESEIRQVYRKSAERLFAKGYDIVIMGHTHLPDDVSITVQDRRCRYLNLGDWVKHFTYLEFDGEEFYTKVHPLRTL